MSDDGGRFLAVTNVPGYLSEQEDIPGFDTAQEAWAFLADERTAEEDDFPEEGGEDYSATRETLACLAEPAHWQHPELPEWLASHGLLPDGQGVVWGLSVPERMHDLGRNYSVIRAAD